MNTSANLLTCSNNLYTAYLLTTYKTLINGVNYAFMNIITNMSPICAELRKITNVPNAPETKFCH